MVKRAPGQKPSITRRGALLLIDFERDGAIAATPPVLTSEYETEVQATAAEELPSAGEVLVVCGGGNNHRIGLYDAFLIKENHLAACGGISNAVARARQMHPGKFLEVEVESLEQLQQAIDAGVERALLDNFSLVDMQRAVELNHQRIELEASGNIEQDKLLEIAGTGVDFISIGALTKNLRAIDFSLRYR